MKQVFCLLEKIHSSLLYNHFNREKVTTLIVTEHPLCLSFLAFTLKTIQGQNTWRNTVLWAALIFFSSLFLPKQSLTAADRACPLFGEEASQSSRGEEEEEAVLGINSGQTLLTFSWLPKQTHPKTHKSSHGIKCAAECI